MVWTTGAAYAKELGITKQAVSKNVKNWNLQTKRAGRKVLFRTEDYQRAWANADPSRALAADGGEAAGAEDGGPEAAAAQAPEEAAVAPVPAPSGNHVVEYQKARAFQKNLEARKAAADHEKRMGRLADVEEFERAIGKVFGEVRDALLNRPRDKDTKLCALSGREFTIALNEHIREVLAAAADKIEGGLLRDGDGGGANGNGANASGPPSPRPT